MTRRAATRPAFTIVEIISASVVIALIAGATTLALARSLKTREIVWARFESLRYAGAAADLIAHDIQALNRESDPLHARLAIFDGISALDQPADQLLLLSRGTRPVRATSPQAEGPIHSVQYRVQGRPAAAAAGPEGTLTLWRRADPFPQDYQDGGGVATPMVDQLVALSIEAYDGVDWFPDWDSDLDGLPHAVRITVTTHSGEPPRQSTARTVVALDRIPLPVGAPECAAPAGPAATGACVTEGGAIACNPVTNSPCDTAGGEACDDNGSGFQCFPPPNDVALCGACSAASGPWCMAGSTCVGNTGTQCAKYCCDDTDCGPGTCFKNDGTNDVFPAAVGLGVCVEGGGGSGGGGSGGGGVGGGGAGGNGAGGS